MRRCSLAVLTLALVAGLAVARPAPAAGIETRITPAMAEMGCTLRLSGPLAEGDLDRLVAAAAPVRVPPRLPSQPLEVK